MRFSLRNFPPMGKYLGNYFHWATLFSIVYISSDVDVAQGIYIEVSFFLFEIVQEMKKNFFGFRATEKISKRDVPHEKSSLESNKYQFPALSFNYQNNWTMEFRYAPSAAKYRVRRNIWAQRHIEMKCPPNSINSPKPRHRDIFFSPISIPASNIQFHAKCEIFRAFHREYAKNIDPKIEVWNFRENPFLGVLQNQKSNLLLSVEKCHVQSWILWKKKILMRRFCH